MLMISWLSNVVVCVWPAAKRYFSDLLFLPISLMSYLLQSPEKALNKARLSMFVSLLTPVLKDES